MSPTRICRIHRILLALFCSFSLWLSGTTPGFAAPFSITDTQGRRLTFSQPPIKIVSIVPSATEILFELGAGEVVQGLTYHDATLKGAEDKVVVGGFFRPVADRIRALEPDLVILGRVHDSMAAAFRAEGIPVFVHETKSVAQAFETILALGGLVGKAEEARELVEKNQAQIDLIQKKLARAVPGKGKRVMRLMGRDRVMTPGADSFQNDLIRLAGGIPPDFGRKGPVIEVSKEEWQAFNPEVVYGCGGDKKAAEILLNRPGWEDADAVKTHQLFYFPCDLTCRAAAHTGYFVQWLSSMIYTDAFADPANEILESRIRSARVLDLDLPYVAGARINHTTIRDFDNKTLMVDFKGPQTIVSTLEGFRTGILAVGNHYSPPPTWGIGHKLGIDNIRARVLSANGKSARTTAFLITGADMDNLSIRTETFKEMSVTALVTAGVMSNALRMSQDAGLFYEPGTINIIIMTNMALSDRAMTRAVIAATEGKTAALEDMDIRSTATPLAHGATGTGTDNVLVVKGEGRPIRNAGGHTKMGELISKAVYAGVNEAVKRQNKVSARRHVFQRLKERRIAVLALASKLSCDCLHQKGMAPEALSQKLEGLLLQQTYAAFIEGAMALSDDYDRGLVKDLSLFYLWCTSVAGRIAGHPLDHIPDYLAQRPEIPVVLRSALNALMAGALNQAGEPDHD